MILVIVYGRFLVRNMGKKRKHSDAAEAVAVPKKDDAAPERPARTLLGWKDKNEINDDVEVKENGYSPVFRNKEKVLVTCSRRIIYRYKPQTLIYPYPFMLRSLCLFRVLVNLLSLVVMNRWCKRFLHPQSIINHDWDDFSIFM